VRSHGKAFDLVVEGEESLAGKVEAVVCLQLAFCDVDEDAFLEVEQLENGQCVSLAREGIAPGSRTWDDRAASATRRSEWLTED
jgi:hypothetical protein